MRITARSQRGKPKKLTLRQPPRYRQVPRLCILTDFALLSGEGEAAKLAHGPSGPGRHPTGGCSYTGLLGAAGNPELGSVDIWRSGHRTQQRQTGKGTRRPAKRLLLLALQLQRALQDALARELAICSPKSPSAPEPPETRRTTRGKQAVSMCL